MTKTLNKYAALKETPDGFLALDRAKSTKEGWTLLGHMIFPIMDLTEVETVKKIKQWRAKDVMQNIWFCHNPTPEGEPCGNCHPCTVKLDSKMYFLLPKEISRKYRLNKLRQKFSKKK